MNDPLARFDSVFGAGEKAVLHLPVVIGSVDGDVATGHRLDDGSAVRIRLGADPKASTRRKPRPPLAALAGKVVQGGVIRFDAAREVADGEFEARWPTILLHRPADGAVMMVWGRALPPFKDAAGRDSIAAELAFPDKAVEVTASAGLRDVLEEAFGIDQPGYAALFLHASIDGRARAELVKPAFTDGKPRPAKDSAAAACERLAAVVDDMLGAGARVRIIPAAIVHMGGDSIAKAVEGSLTPDTWFRPARDTVGTPAGGETAFAFCSVALRPRSNGSFYFTEIKPLHGRPDLRTPAQLL